MNILKINPYIRHTMHSLVSPHVQIKRRIILDYELLYIESGQLQLIYNERKFIFSQGDILLFCPNVPHIFQVLDVPLSQPHIHFDVKYDTQSKDAFISFQDYNELTPAQRQLIRENIFPDLIHTPLLNIVDKEAFLKLFYEIIDSKNPNSLSCKAKMLCLLETIITDNELPTTSTVTPPSVAFLIKSYIDANYDQPISLGILERQFGYSKFHIEKLFKQEYGISVMNYRAKKRMEGALTLLEKNSVSETAALLGFSSIYAFSRAFRAYHGTSPTKHTRPSTD